jgi:magnesium transporter
MNSSLGVAALDLLARTETAAVATQMTRLSRSLLSDALAEISSKGQATLLPWIDPDVAARFLEKMDKDALEEVLRDIEPKDSARILARFAPAVLAERLQSIPEDLRSEIRLLLRFPKDSAGAIMDPRAVLVRRDDSASSALRKARKRGRSVMDVLVVEADGRLVGTAAIAALALAESGASVGSLMKTPVPSVNAMSPREDAVESFRHNGIATLPVTHVDGTVLGVLRADRLSEVASEEAGNDMLTMVGADPEERALSGVGFSVSKRLPWLGINLLTAFLASAVVGLFESTIAQVSALAVLLPIVAGQSGNTGAQAMAVAMRGLAVREILPRHWLRVMFKEIRVGIINGVAVAIATGLSVWWWSGQPALGGVIGVAMVIAMGIASAAGALVPLGLSAIGRDPAQSSSIVLTTITDVFGFFAFLGLATLFVSALSG